MIEFVHVYTKTGRGHSIVAMEGNTVKASGSVAGYKSPAKLELDGVQYICFNEVFEGKVPVDVVLAVVPQPTRVQGLPASKVEDAE